MCFEIVPTYPDNLPEAPLVQDKNIMQMFENQKTTHKLSWNYRDDRFCTIKFARGNKFEEYKFIIETYKERPTNKSEVHFETKHNFDKTMITVNLSEEQQDSNLLFTAETNHVTSDDDEFFMIQY